MMKHKLSVSKRWVLAGIIVLILAIGGGWFVFWYDMNVGFGAPESPNFKGYITLQELAGASLQNAELFRIKQYGLDAWDFEYKLTYDKDGVLVYERDANKYPWSVANCDKWTKGSADYGLDCKVSPLGNGGRYMTIVNTYKGEFSSLQVEALIGTTQFYVGLPTDKALMQTYVTYDWGAYFDSMKAVDLRKLPYSTTVHHQGGR